MYQPVTELSIIYLIVLVYGLGLCVSENTFPFCFLTVIKYAGSSLLVISPNSKVGSFNKFQSILTNTTINPTKETIVPKSINSCGFS